MKLTRGWCLKDHLGSYWIEYMKKTKKSLFKEMKFLLRAGIKVKPVYIIIKETK